MQLTYIDTEGTLKVCIDCLAELQCLCHHAQAQAVLWTVALDSI